MRTVSVIIPAYNAAAYVRKSIESALGQHGVAVEVIVIDDGSTDDTPRILGEFGGSIRVIRQANAGPVQARNKGAELASGEWLAFLDADDEWLPDKLAKQLALTGERTHLVYTERENFGDDLRVPTRQSATQPVWDGEIFDELLVHGNFITTSSVMIRKAVFERLGGFEGEFLPCEDWDLWLRYSAEGGLTTVCREPLTRYRWHGTSISNGLARMHGARLKVVRRALGSPRGRQLTGRLRRQAIALVWETSAWYAVRALPVRAFYWYCRSALAWPWKPAVYRSMIKCCLRMA